MKVRQWRIERNKDRNRKMVKKSQSMMEREERERKMEEKGKEIYKIKIE